MFKKQLLIIAILGAICAGVVGYSAITVSNSANSFDTSGYVHTTASTNTNKRILFNSGTSYKNKAEDTVTFSDVLGDKANVNKNNFIHYDDSSLSSFSNGVIVDLDDLSATTAMNHYSVPANTVLRYSGSTYSADNSDYGFKDFIWKLNENKYIVVSPSMNFRVANDDQKTINNYAEVSYIGDGLVQLQTEENIWQYISQDCHLVTNNGMDIDLSQRNVSDNNGNVFLDFNRIVVDSNSNIELSPLADSTKETVIPHFSITAENGADGLSGTSGESGESGASGKPGDPGVRGQDGQDGIDGEDSIIGGDILNFPVFKVYDWSVSGTTCKGSIGVTDPDDMLQDNSTTVFGALYLVDLDTGERIFNTTYPDSYDAVRFKETTSDADRFEFEFKNLKTDHSYMLMALAPTQPDSESETYSRQYVAKTFWTDSLGVYMEAGPSTTTSVSFDIINQNYVPGGAENATIYYKVFKTYDAAAAATLDYPGWAPQSGEPKIIFAEDSATGYYTCHLEVPNNTYAEDNDFVAHLALATGDRNKVYVRVGYCFPGDDPNTSHLISEMSSQILELTPLNQKPTIGFPILTQNRNTWGFDVTPTCIEDPNGGIVSYTYEFYTLDSFKDSSDELKTNAQPVKTVTKYDGKYITVPLDGTDLKAGETYRVRIVAQFDDGEKIYDVASDFSNSATLEGSVRPNVYFQSFLSSGATYQMGKNVELPFYDTAYGYLHIIPGINSSRLMIDHDHHPQVEVTYNGYYKATYLLYLKSDQATIPAGQGYLLVDDTDDINAGSVRVLFNDDHFAVSDPEGTVLTNPAATGLRPNSSYSITVTGDLTEDGTTVSETNVEVGTCIVTTKALSTLGASWTYNANDEENTLKKATLKLFNPNADDQDKTYQYIREVQNLSEIHLRLYTTELTIVEIEEHSATAKKELTIKPDDIDPRNGKKYYDELFGSDGLECDLELFDLTVDDLKDSHGDLPKKYTLYISDAYDYTIDVRNRDAQAAFKNVNNTGKIRANNGTYYYVNEFPFYEQDTQRLVISASTGLEPIKATKDFVNDGPTKVNVDGIEAYEMRAQYDNGTNTAGNGYITYYVFDAVDFFAGDRIDGKNWNDELGGTQLGTPAKVGGFEQYEYTPKYDASHPVTYPQNPFFKQWITTSVDYTDTTTSSVLQYETPCNAYGLALATITVRVPDKASSMPSVVFCPMSLDEYKNTHGGTAPSVKDSNNSYYMFFGETDAINYTKWTDAGYYTPKSEHIPERGHQYVFAWTLCCHKEEEQAKYVFPFDSYISAAGSDPKTEFKTIAADISDSASTHTRTKTSGMASTAIKSSAAIGNSAGSDNKSYYLLDNPNATYGFSGYMLIPHSTFTKCPASNAPFNDASCFFVPWDYKPNEDVVRAAVYQTDETVYTPTAGTVQVFNYKSIASGTYNSLGQTVPVNTTTANTEAAAFEAGVTSQLLQSSKPASVGEITVTPSHINEDLGTMGETNTGEVIGVIPIQRYVNKYVNNNAPIHASGSNKYIDKSDDTNWQPVDIINKSNHYYDTYKELFVASFDNKEFDDHEGDVNSKLSYTDNAKATFEWIVEGDEKKSAGVVITAKKELVKNAYGIRIYFTGVDKTTHNKETFYVDKYIQNASALDRYSVAVSGTTSTKPFIEDAGDDKYRIAFLINNSKELAQASSGDGSNYDFSNQTGIQIRIRFLYDTGLSGFGLLSGSYAPSYSTHNPNFVGFALKRYTIGLHSGSSTTNQTYSFLVDNGNPYYQMFGDASGSTSALSKIGSLRGSQAASAPRLGSFFRMRLDSNELQIKSTRQWEFGGSNYSRAVIIGSRLDNALTISMPVKLKEAPADYEDQTIFIDPDFGSDVEMNDDDGDGKYEYFIYSPETPPIITYQSVDDDVIKITDALLYYSISGADPNMYFTISSDDPDKIDNNSDYRPDTSKGHYYQVSPAIAPASGFDVETTPIDDGTGTGTKKAPTHELNITSNAETKASSSGPVTFEASGTIYDNLKDYMMKVDGGLTAIQLNKLMANTKYYITCWRWTKVQSDPDGTEHYGFMRIKEQVTGSPLNSFDFKTSPWPQAKIIPYPNADDPLRKITANDVDTYFAYEDDRKLIYSRFEMAKYDPANNYYVIELLEDLSTETTEDYKFVSFLSCKKAITDLWVDVDNITTDEDTNLNAVIGYTIDDTNDSDPDTRNAAKRKYFDYTASADPTNPVAKFVDDLSTVGQPMKLEYGHKYVLKLHVYEDGTGPAYDDNYDFDLDGDSEFIDAAHPEESPDPVVRKFKIPDVLDRIRILSDSSVVADKASTIRFSVQTPTINSASIKENKYLPVAVLQHKVLDGDGNPTGAIEYYDVTNRLYLENGDKIRTDGKHLVSQGQNLLINISKPNPDPTSENKYINIFNTGDVVYLYLYAYQGANATIIPSNDDKTAGFVTGIPAFNNDTERVNAIMAGRKEGGGVYTPYYSEPNDDTDTSAYGDAWKISDAQLTLLKENLTGSSADDKHSRLMANKYETVKEVKVCVGNITVIFQETDTPISKKGLHITLNNSTAPSGLHACAYTVWAETVITDEYGEQSDGKLPRDGEANAPLTKHSLITKKSDGTITPYLNDSKNSLQFDLPYLSDIMPNEVVWQWHITIYFTTTDLEVLGTADEKRAKYADDVDTEPGSDQEVYTYTFTKEGVKETTTTFSMPNFSLKNLGNGLLGKLFNNKEGGAE